MQIIKQLYANLMQAACRALPNKILRNILVTILLAAVLILSLRLIIEYVSNRRSESRYEKNISEADALINSLDSRAKNAQNNAEILSERSNRGQTAINTHRKKDEDLKKRRRELDEKARKLEKELEKSNSNSTVNLSDSDHTRGANLEQLLENR